VTGEPALRRATAADLPAIVALLTTDKSRTDAHHFYERLGFKPSHAGYKMDLPRP
jgi:N-acetylglutamate synthase-like GNAT family acetyltransferase